MTKEDDEHFHSSRKCWIRDNIFVEGDNKVRDNYKVTGKHRVTGNRDCSTNVSLNYKITIVFHVLKI